MLIPEDEACTFLWKQAYRSGTQVDSQARHTSVRHDLRVSHTIESARAEILAAIGPVLGTEQVSLEEAGARVLAETITAPHDLPPFQASAMDGFAALPNPAGTRLEIVGESRAGHPFTGSPKDGEAIVISTGAVAPVGVGVAPVETVEAGEGAIELLNDLSAGAHVRMAGEDLAGGSTALEPGTTLDAASLALAASCGRTEVICAEKPRVSIIVTGDELAAAGEPLSAGQIHDSNRTALSELVREAGGTVIAATTTRDQKESTVEALRMALDQSDVVITSGGVSVGEHDFVRPALAELGVEEVFWRIAMKPGGPTWFGMRGRIPVFGLPGNPVSAFVTFQLFARPAIRKLLGAQPLPVQWPCVLGESVRVGPRQQAVRVRVEPTGDGPPIVWLTGAQGSHRTSSIPGAWGLALLPAGDGELAAGSLVPVEPIAG